MENKLHIVLKERIGSAALTRDLVKSIILDYIRQKKSDINLIEIDFSGIDSISRSFADELYKNQLFISNVKRIPVLFSNLSKNASAMLEKVKKSNDPAFQRDYSPNSNLLLFSERNSFKEYLRKME